MSDELRVPGYVETPYAWRTSDTPKPLSPAELDLAAQRAYGAFWGVLGSISEQWAHMSEERKDCWRGVVRAVLGS